MEYSWSDRLRHMHFMCMTADPEWTMDYINHQRGLTYMQGTVFSQLMVVAAYTRGTKEVMEQLLPDDVNLDTIEEIEDASDIMLAS